MINKDCGVINFNIEEEIGQEVIGVESKSLRAFQKEQSPQSNTGTMEGKQRVKCPKVLHAQIITEEETILPCKRICITEIENITIETTEDGKQKIVRCTEKHPNLTAFDDQLLNYFSKIKIILTKGQTS